MQNNFTIRPNLIITCLALLLGGCASDPAPAPILSGEQMLSESQGIANLGDRWKKVSSWLSAVMCWFAKAKIKLLKVTD